jgi:hypothetical protein
MGETDVPEVTVRNLTPEEAQAAYDAAPAVPLSAERIQGIVAYATQDDIGAGDVEPVNEHARKLWRECRAAILNPDCGGMTQLIALFVKEILEMEERLAQQTDRLYAVRKERDQLQWMLEQAGGARR